MGLNTNLKSRRRFPNLATLGVCLPDENGKDMVDKQATDKRESGDKLGRSVQ
jgi:hypothetical protein